jgi:ferrochelatase
LKRGILLVNLGSPDSADVRDVRRYLGEFLMDRYVIDVPWLLRRTIVSAFILPFRPRKTAAAYASIWTPEGSPLLAHSRALAQAIERAIELPVALAMRYGKPSLATAIDALIEAGVDEILLVPLYPQHADSTRTTTIVRVRELLARRADAPALRVLPPFWGDRGYAAALAARVRSHVEADIEHVLFSFHGLPERHLTKADPTGSHCLKRTDCCEVDSPAHATCYRHQSFATARAVAAALGWRPDFWSVSFQSRLGREPWLAPYTDKIVDEFAARGMRRLAVVCPAFVADNLETLEEIGVRAREQFLAAGGERLTLVPCLNDDPHWIDALAALCLDPPPMTAFDAAP